MPLARIDLVQGKSAEYRRIAFEHSTFAGPLVVLE